MKKKNTWLFLLCGTLLCCSLYLGVRGMATAFERETEMKEVNQMTWTLHPCDIGNDFTYIKYDDRYRVFLADGVADYAGGSEDGRPIAETGEAMTDPEKYDQLHDLYLIASQRGEDGQKRFGCFRYDGSVAIPFEYDGLEGFVGDYCIAWKAPKLMIINKNNETVYTAPDSSGLKWLAEDIFSTEKRGRTEVFRIIEDEAVPAKADSSAGSGKAAAVDRESVSSRNGIQIFVEDEKYGLKNEDGKILVGAVFDSLQFAGNRYLIAVYRGRYGIADWKPLAVS